MRVCVHMELGLGTHCRRRVRGAMNKVNRAKGGGTSMASAGMSPSSTTTFSRLRRCTQGNVYTQKRREETRHATTDYGRNSVSYGGISGIGVNPGYAAFFQRKIESAGITDNNGSRGWE